MQSLHLVGSSPKRRVFKKTVGSLGWAFPQGVELGAAVPGCAVGHINPQSWYSSGDLPKDVVRVCSVAWLCVKHQLQKMPWMSCLRMCSLMVWAWDCLMCWFHSVTPGFILGIKDLNCSVKFFILRKANIILEREQRHLWNKKSRQVHLKQPFSTLLMLPKPWIPHVVVILNP